MAPWRRGDLRSEWASRDEPYVDEVAGVAAGFAARAAGALRHPASGLAAAGRTEVIEGLDHNQIVVLLHPAARAQPPLARTFTFGQGWNPRPSGEASSEPHWTNGCASLTYYNPSPGPLQVSLRLVASGVDERILRILINGREQLHLRVGLVPKEINLPAAEFHPGVNRIDFDTPEPAVRVSEQRWRLRAIGVQRLQLQVLSGPETGLVDVSDDAPAGGDPGPLGSVDFR